MLTLFYDASAQDAVNRDNGSVYWARDRLSNEKVWKESYKGKELSDLEIIEAMVKNPKLIERPIIINKNKAVIGRPTEKISTIISI